MKKILLLISLLVSVLTFAQNKGITYQAVIYNTSGESVPGIHNSNSPLVNKSICLQFSIVDENTQTEYQEKVTVTTDDFGMVNLVIGNGTQTAGYASSFNAIVWTNAQKYLKVSLDQSGNCSAFEEISNQVLTYVPFALAANSASTVSGVVSIAHGGTNATTVLGAKSNLQLQNVDNTSDLNKPLSTATQTALNTKVDKVTGKDLSTNDYTTAEKTKLASLGGTPDLSGYATLVNLNTKVDKVTGKDLSTNDYTTAEKTKLGSISGVNTGDQDLSLLAPLLSPSLSGIPTAPTAASGSNSTQLATTAFVANAVNNSAGGSFVDLTTNQTIAGSKTFSTDLNVSGLTIGGTSNTTILGANASGGPFSTTIGNNASSPSSYSVAIGRYSNAMTSYSVAIGGLNAKASESYSIAIGGNAPEATGVYSTAIGGNVPKATALQSTALGS